MATAVYWRRVGFRGSNGFGAEVRNGLGRPTASDISAACPLRLFPPGLRCAPAQPPTPPPRVAPRWDLGIGLLRLGSSISVRAGRAGRSLPGTPAGPGSGAVLPPSLSGADAGSFACGPTIPTCTCADGGVGGPNEVLGPGGHRLRLGQVRA